MDLTSNQELILWLGTAGMALGAVIIAAIGFSLPNRERHHVTASFFVCAHLRRYSTLRHIPTTRTHVYLRGLHVDATSVPDMCRLRAETADRTSSVVSKGHRSD